VTQEQSALILTQPLTPTTTALHPPQTDTGSKKHLTMRLALTLSAALMATGALAFVPPVPSMRRSTKLVSFVWCATGSSTCKHIHVHACFVWALAYVCCEDCMCVY
jgi:hypothetical protein